MSIYQSLTKREIEKIYSNILKFHTKYLKKFGVKLPNLYTRDKNYSKNALVLVYLARDYPNTQKTDKKELTAFVRSFYPNTNDVQQARHLGAQDGWWIVAGGRDNIVLNLKRGFYQLYSLTEKYPAFTRERRTIDFANWEELKENFNYRCLTCGSKEGEPHLHWPATKTKLQKAHKNPNKPLHRENIIVQCQKCNRADRNRWVYDNKGRVVKLADANFVKNFDKPVREKIYQILFKEFEGKNPNEK